MKAIAILLLAALVVGCGVAPTPSPSPTAISVQPEPNPALVAFEGHVAEAITREGQLIRQLAAASAGTNTELRIAASQLVDWAVVEFAWLDANPAESCFAEAADAYRDGIDEIAAAGTAFKAGPGEADLQAAGARLASGTESLEQAATLARSARVACR